MRVTPSRTPVITADLYQPAGHRNSVLNADGRDVLRIQRREVEPPAIVVVETATTARTREMVTKAGAVRIMSVRRLAPIFARQSIDSAGSDGIVGHDP